MLDKPSPYDPTIVKDLVTRWQRNRDERARDELFRRFMPVVRSVARKWGSKYRVHRDDADQEAALGFLKAVEKFNPEMGTLENYVRLWARSRIGYARHVELPMSLPSSAFNDTTTAAWAGVKLRRRLSRFARVEEISAETGMSIARTETALATRRMETLVVSVDTPIGEDGFTIGDTIAADAAERPDAIVEEASTTAAARAAFEAVLATFVPRHQEAIRLRLWEGLTLEETGERMGVTRERVRQIELKALPRLREALFDHPAVLALLGRDAVHVDEVADDESGALLNVAEVEARTRFDRSTITEMVGRGAFPRSVAKDNRGNRLWREAAVERWLGSRGAAMLEVE